MVLMSIGGFIKNMRSQSIKKAAHANND